MDTVVVKNLDLDKICRVCLAIKKEMRPLFGEMVAEMLMEFAKIQLENLEGWPDKICLQCIHQVSRCHAFKTRVEKSDIALRQYIKGITGEDMDEPKDEIIIETQRLSDVDATKIQTMQQHQAPQMQELHIHRSDIQTVTEQPTTPTMILTSAQLINTGTQIINAGQIITTATGQQILQAAPQYQATPIGQFIQGPNNTVQMITHNGHPAQVLQIQRTADDRCEIIMQPDLSEAQYMENVSSVPVMIATGPANTTTTITTNPQNTMHPAQEHEPQHEQTIELKEIDESECGVIVEDEIVETDEIIEEDSGGLEEAEMECYQMETEYETDEEEKQLAEFVTFQTSCPSPGRYVCNLCHKEFNQPKWLQTHMSSHTNWIKANCKKQPQCEICHKSFRGPGMLRMHMKTHEKANRIPTCSICHKEFKTKSILYRHRQTHFEKTFECTMCEKKFSSNYQLNSHVQRHKKLKTQKCPHCDKAFYNSTELKNHIQQHLGVKVIQIKKAESPLPS